MLDVSRKSQTRVLTKMFGRKGQRHEARGRGESNKGKEREMKVGVNQHSGTVECSEIARRQRGSQQREVKT